MDEPHLVSRVLAFLLCAATAGIGVSSGAAAQDLPATEAGVFQLRPLPGAHGQQLMALERSERLPQLRYRVIVLPGSGCAGMRA